MQTSKSLRLIILPLLVATSVVATDDCWNYPEGHHDACESGKKGKKGGEKGKKGYTDDLYDDDCWQYPEGHHDACESGKKGKKGYTDDLYDDDCWQYPKGHHDACESGKKGKEGTKGKKGGKKGGSDSVDTLRINCGAKEDVTLGGVFWGQDDMFFTGGDMMEDKDEPYIRGAGDLSELFWSERAGESGNFMYELPAVVDGDYSVTLYFSEPAFDESEVRTFDIYIQGEPAAEDFDIYDEAGGMDSMVARTFYAFADDAAVTVEFRSVKETPKVNAIELEFYGGYGGGKKGTKGGKKGNTGKTGKKGKKGDDDDCWQYPEGHHDAC